MSVACCDMTCCKQSGRGGSVSGGNGLLVGLESQPGDLWTNNYKCHVYDLMVSRLVLRRMSSVFLFLPFIIIIIIIITTIIIIIIIIIIVIVV